MQGQRILLRILLVCGILLCLTPTGASLWVSWKLILKPIVANGGEPIRNQNQLELQMAMRRDPVFLVTVFALAPAGVGMVAFSLMRLRRLKQLPPPGLPDDYGLHRPGR